MQTIALSSYTEKNIYQLLEQIPLFSDLSLQGDTELDELLKSSKVIDLNIGEKLLEKGSRSSYFYVLLEGALDVFGETEPGKEALNQIAGVQLFGVLGAVNFDNRSATLAGSRNNTTQVLAIDYGVFGDLCNFDTISLNTKLKLYRNVVNNTRWKLEVYQKATKDITLEQELRLYPPFGGEKETVDELLSLATQAKGLGDLLDCWNECTEANIILPDLTACGKRDASIFSNLKNILTKKVIWQCELHLPSGKKEAVSIIF